MVPPVTEYRFSIPYILPSLNQQQRMHWTGRARLKQRCMEYLQVARSEARKHKRPWPKGLTRFWLTIERWAPRRLDPDNLVGAQKPLIDAMKLKSGLGLIADDSPAQLLNFTVSQEKCDAKESRTVIVLQGI